MFTLDVNMPAVKAAMFAQGAGVVADVDIWHKRIGHVNEQRLRTMQSKLIVAGLPKLRVDGMHKVCEACQFGKQSRNSFPQERNVCKRPLEVVHTDVWGPTKTTSIHGSRYYASFIDDHTKKVCVYFMKQKSKVFDHFKIFKAAVEKETGEQVKTLRSDGGGEYFSKEFSDFLQKMVYAGSSHVDTLHNKMELLSKRTYILQRTPTAIVHGVTPEEKYSGKKPDLSHFKLFGCIAYVHIPDELRTKLDPKAEKCIFVGYSNEQKGDVKDNIAADVKDPVDASSGKQESQTLSGPREFSSSGSIFRPWSGRLRTQVTSQSAPQVSRKGKEKVGEPPCMMSVSSGSSHIDADFDGLDQSLDEEFGIPAVRTLGVRKQAARTLGSNSGWRRSNRVRFLVDREETLEDHGLHEIDDKETCSDHSCDKEQPHYNEVIRERDNAVIRYCRASDECPNKKRAFEKRIEIIRHLETHGIHVTIPKRSRGRPKSHGSSSTMSSSSRSSRQCERRFTKIDLKVNNARRKHIRDLKKKAPNTWDLVVSKGKTTLCYEEWLEAYIKAEMEDWEKGMRHRIAMIKLHIKEGYENSKRKKTSAEDERSNQNDAEKKENDIDKTPDLSKGKRTKVPKAPCKDLKNKASSSATQTTNTRQPKFPPTTPISVNSPRESEGLKHVYVDITKDLLDCKSPPPSTIESFMASLRDGTTFHLRSTRYNLAVDCDVKVIDSIADVDASSNAMNLFAFLWHSYILQTVSELAMENYFGKVDLSKYTFTFFPIVDRSYWTLMVFFNGHVRRLPGLPFGKSSILFFDSLGQRSIIDYIPRVERVFKHYARFFSEGHMKDELMDPHRFCHIATIETPIQPNGYDCGYYVMTVMLSLILGGLQHKRSQKWLSSKWFNHDDVRRLKEPASTVQNMNHIGMPTPNWLGNTAANSGSPNAFVLNVESIAQELF
ncbi:hypothetical protein L7F22_062824 [Adiantum nelumboides]|nr:hypothetical protein [Adiantum nelumboides]